jgi:hypothetical protein
MGYASFTDMRNNYQKALAVNPWLYSYPVYLTDVRPVKDGLKRFLVDATGEVIPLHTDYQNFYAILAVSGGGAMSLFGEFDGYQILPLSIITGMGLVQA